MLFDEATSFPTGNKLIAQHGSANSAKLKDIWYNPASVFSAMTRPKGLERPCTEKF